MKPIVIFSGLLVSLIAGAEEGFYKYEHRGYTEIAHRQNGFIHSF